MPDVHNTATRSKNMAAIKAKDTKPELLIRKLLHKEGFRYKLHDKSLPGKPDLVFPKHKAIIFINGCFWHKHDCHLFKWPQSREDFWKQKVTANASNDHKKLRLLKANGWRVGIVWECALKGKNRISIDTTIKRLADWLNSERQTIGIRGMIA